MTKWIAILSFAVAALGGAGSVARADCEYWSDWAYRYNCTDQGGAQAKISNFAGEVYEVRCGLEHDDCSNSGTSSEDFWWYSLGDVCQVDSGVRVQLVASLINGITNQRDTEEYEFGPNDNLCTTHRKYPDNSDWNYNVIGCRVGFNCH